MKATYGNTPAALVLEKLVEGHTSARRRISSLLSEFSKDLLTITKIDDDKVVKFYMLKRRDHAIDCLSKKSTLTPEMRSYASNVIKTRWRLALDAYQTVQAYRNAEKKH